MRDGEAGGEATPPVAAGWERRAITALLAAQALVFVALPLAGSPHSWSVLSGYFAEIASDMLGGAESPLDGYEGLSAGPLLWGALEAPLLLLLGRVGLVHVLATLGLALATTLAGWAFARRWMGAAGALAVAGLLAFPAPNTWIHQHYGAYHVLPLLTVPLGLLGLLPGGPDAPGRPGGPGAGGWPAMRRVASAALLLSSAVWSTGAVGVVVPLMFLSWGWVARTAWRDAGMRGAARVSAEFAGGALLAGLPVLWKLLLHEPFGGLLAGLPAGAGAGAASKPFFVRPAAAAELPPRLLRFFGSEFPAGWHFGLHGVPGLDLLASLLAAAALLACARAAWRREIPFGIAMMALSTLSALTVGVLTGWFSVIPSEARDFERGTRHLVGLQHGLAFLAGYAVDLGLRARHVRGAPGARWRTRIARVPAAAATLLVLGGLSTQLLDLAAALAEPAPFAAGPRSPWRLESRYVSGFFRGPHFVGREEAGARSCAALPAMQRADCLRGVAMALGHVASRAPGPANPALDASCGRLRSAAALPDATAALLDTWCGMGLGWGRAQRAFGLPVKAAAACRGDGPRATDCLRGMGWGLAQDFADRPATLVHWQSSLLPADRPAFAEGIGAYVHMVAAERRFAARLCARLAGEHAVDCETGMGLGAGFMR